jgi:hypothetical protein
MTGPHAKEIQGVANRWEEHMRSALAELKIVRASLDQTKVRATNAAFERIYDVRAQASELLQLLRQNYKWLFTDVNIRKPREFAALLGRLLVPSRNDLGIRDAPTYRSRQERVDWWQDRLNATEYGENEPLANLIDALALDQLEQIVSTAHKVPILVTHSAKIFEALRHERETNADFFRWHGVSLAQPPQIALVQRLRSDAARSGNIEQLTEELTRQQARGEEVYDLISDIVTGRRDPQAIDSRIETDIQEFEENWRQWDALQQVLQTLETPENIPGMLSGLEKILHETSPDDTAEFQRLLIAELDELITELDLMQAKIANRLAPPEAPEELQLLPQDARELENRAVRFRPGPRVRSAVYPVATFRFSDPEVVKCLHEIADGLESLKNATAGEPAKAHVNNLWNQARERLESERRPEFLLLFSVLYLTQEKWMQAYDMATRGLLLQDSNDGVNGKQSSARAELLLARAGARRAFVHAHRMDFPNDCREFLQGTVEDCLKSLAVQREDGETLPDRRCLRELAVTFCASHDPVYGPRRAEKSIALTLDPASVVEDLDVSGANGDPLLLAEVFARQACRQPIADAQMKSLFANTHLYVMTEIDRRFLDNGQEPQYEAERIDLAEKLDSGGDDPNFLDTLMWHWWVLARTRKLRNDNSWLDFANRAKNIADTLPNHPGLVGPDTNQYYYRLARYHRRRVNSAMSEAP